MNCLSNNCPNKLNLGKNGKYSHFFCRYCRYEIWKELKDIRFEMWLQGKAIKV